jgi:predicted nucleotidyltransferase component of viral defense system
MKVDLERPGPWQPLFRSAMVLVDDLERVLHQPTCTFGGGTVLMLRLNHRHSKDIDIFVPDPQYLGYVTPRLSDAAESLTQEYVEAAEFVKLFLPGGEIDIVVGEPLTDEPWEEVRHQGRTLRIETNAEILAKKMHFRGDRAEARDLFDLCAVAEHDPDAIERASPFFRRHAEAFLATLERHASYAAEEFEQIDRIAYRRSFEECISIAQAVLAEYS